MRLAMYLGRWQLSSPILAACVVLLPGPAWFRVIIANLIGGLLFFRVDRWIMGRRPDLQNGDGPLE